jgi:transposase
MALSDETSWRDDVTASPGDEAVIAALQAGGALLRSQHAALTARIAELERRLGLNSSKSFKPPRRAMG